MGHCKGRFTLFWCWWCFLLVFFNVNLVTPMGGIASPASMGHKDVEPSNHYCFSNNHGSVENGKRFDDLKGSYSWRYTPFDHFLDYGREEYWIENLDPSVQERSFFCKKGTLGLRRFFKTIPFDHLLAGAKLGGLLNITRTVTELFQGFDSGTTTSFTTLRVSGRWFFSPAFWCKMVVKFGEETFIASRSWY